MRSIQCLWIVGKKLEFLVYKSNKKVYTFFVSRFFNNFFGGEKMKVLNLMQHNLTEIQLEELNGAGVQEIVHLTTLNEKTFNSLKKITKEATVASLTQHAAAILATGFKMFLVPIGSPLFMAILTKMAVKSGKSITFFFAFSERKVIEKKEEDKVVKTTIFEHVRFDHITL